MKGYDMAGSEKTVRVLEKVHKANDLLAEENRGFFAERRLFVVNVLGSPGCGKTTLIDATRRGLEGIAVAVIEGDVAGDVDARHFAEQGVPAIQINTGGGCHLDAAMVKQAVADLAAPDDSAVFIENVGNLICTSGFDLGEGLRVLCLSTPEGDDKPLKYPGIFRGADALVITKSELAEYVGFRFDDVKKRASLLNEELPVFEVSAKTGDGMEPWCRWLAAKMRD